MTLEERLDLIRQVGEEIVSEEELITLLESNEPLIAYDGFEPSGQIHIAQGLLRAINVNKMIKAGVHFKMLVADWHAMANNKMGGDLEKIQTVGKYFIEVWKASGMDLSKVEFVWASNLVKDPKYWQLVLRVGITNKLRRFVRTAEIMGRAESIDNLTAAQIIYPCMQTADIFYLGAKICQLGMDQRKVNMLAREVGPMLGYWKPVVVSHHMLMGLNVKTQMSNVKTTTQNEKLQKTIELKMSKSHPDSAIFMTDTKEDIKRKITKAYCPEGQIVDNPILEYYKYIIFESLDRLQMNNIFIDRPIKFGGPVVLNSYENLEKLFVAKKLHPLDIKHTAITLLDKLIAPVRLHFQNNIFAKDLLTKVQSFQITR
jgi:tyrosyl-tRNA synthetase